MTQLECRTASGVCDIVDINTVTRIDIGIDLNWFENPDISFVALDQDIVNDICLVHRVEDIGRRLRSELCGTDEQHRMKLSNAYILLQF